MSGAAAPKPKRLASWSDLSLTRRIMLVAAIWGMLVLIGGALALSAIYRTQTLTLLEEDLERTLIELTRDMTREGAFLEDGRVTDTDRFFLENDTRFTTQFSGNYWAVVGVDETGKITGYLPSNSLWTEPVPITDQLLARSLEHPGITRFADAGGPVDQTLHVAAKAIIIDNRATPLVLVSAADRSRNDEAAVRFRNLLLVTMIALFGSVFAAMAVAVFFSLRPLARIGQDIADIREGRRQKLRENYPSEVRPLTEELNKLIDHNRNVVERARMHVGNLAHALKTPLAVLRNEASGASQLDDVVRRQTDAMHTNVEHYLRRARVAARAETLGARCEMRPVLDGLARMLNRLFDAKGVHVSINGGAGAVFRGERQDFEELVGNLMENACKWARSRVCVDVQDRPDALVILVGDDGPGLSPEEREAALRRGVRLDETMPGTGLGLSIVAELAELYRGRFTLGESALGGLEARLTFPK